VESPFCHAERVNFAGKTDLPRNEGFSSDKQNSQALSFPKYAFKIKATRCLRLTFSPVHVCNDQASSIRMSSSL